MSSAERIYYVKRARGTEVRRSKVRSTTRSGAQKVAAGRWPGWEILDISRKGMHLDGEETAELLWGDGE